MATYSFNNSMGGSQASLGGTYKTILVATANTSTLTTARIKEVSFGPGAAPNATDCTIEYDLSFQNAAGTATAVTPVPRDPSNTRAAGTVCAVNATAEGTIVNASSRLFRGLNQRAAYRWTALDEGDMIIVPAVNASGYALRARSAGYTGTIDAEIAFSE
jgi:hypothetical protein